MRVIYVVFLYNVPAILKKPIENPSGPEASWEQIEKIASLISSIEKGLCGHVAFSGVKDLPFHSMNLHLVDDF